jgi:hypothetical protein
MDYRHINQSRLDVAKVAGLEIIDQLPRDSEIVVLDTSSTRSQFDMDRGAASERIKQLTSGGANPALNGIVDNALSLVQKSDRARKEVYLLTDMAAVDWDSKAAHSNWQRRLEDYPEVNFYLIDIGVRQPQNFSLSDLRLSRDVVSETDLIRVTAELECLGAAGRQLVELYLFDEEGNREKKGEKLIDCVEGAASQIDFQTRMGSEGTVHGYLQLSRGDDLEVDNRRYFTVAVRDPYQILIVAPQPAERHSRMLSTALCPPTLRQQGETQHEIRVISYEELAAESLAALDAVWLLDPPPLSAKLWDQLSSFVDAGGGLAMALGGSVGTSPARFNETASWELMPAPLLRQWRGELSLAPNRLEHPVLQRLKIREAAIPWRENPIFKIWELDPVGEGSRVVMPYSNGQPALLARDLGQGRFLLLTTSLTSGNRSAWNELLAPREMAWPGFVLVTAMADYLVGSAGQRLNYLTGEVARLQVDAEHKDFDSYLLKTPTGSRRIAPDDRGRQLLIHGMETPGHYRIGAGGQQGAEYGFSVNLPAEATDLERMDFGKWSARFDKNRLPILTGVNQLSRIRQDVEARTRWEAAPWLIMILTMVVAAEGLLATFFYRKPKTKSLQQHSLQ